MNSYFKNLLVAVTFTISVTSLFAQGATGAIAPSLSSNSNSMVSRAPDARGWTDPALNHNRLLQQQSSDGMYKLIGPYKVIGSSFLFGEHHKGDMFSSDAKAYNVYVSYNTYNQEVEFYSTSNPDKPLVREAGTLDSFIIQADIAAGITKDLKFVYGSLLGVKDKYYYLEVCKGDKYNLYKRYKSDLGYSSNNYATSELRQFDLEYEYYYSDGSGNGLKKMKASTGGMIKEFKQVTDLSSVLNNDLFIANPENEMCKAFSALNNVKRAF